MMGRKPAALVGFAVFFLFCLASLPADVIYLRDGSILVAKFHSASGDEMLYKKGNGEELRIRAAEILGSDPDFRNLTGKKVRIILTDKTFIDGLFNDYDEDIGVFIDLSFGTLTVPSGKIDKIVDPVQARKFAGSDVSLSARGTFLLPLEGDYFSFMAGGGLGAEFKLPFMRGLFAGVDVDGLGFMNGTVEELSYFGLLISPKVVYRFLDLRTKNGFVSRLAPYAAVGGGILFLFVQDQRSGVFPENYGAMSPHAKAEIGLFFYINEAWSLKLNGTYLAVFQEEELFHAAGGNLSVCFEF